MSQGPPFTFSRGRDAASADASVADAESRRLTPSVDVARGEAPADSSNEDFLFHLYRGSELLQDNRVHEAKEELERALHLQPRDSKGQDLLAVVYFRLGLYPRAIQIYEELRTKNPDDTALLLNLALCYLKTGQPQLARRDLQHLLALNPSHSRAWGYLGFACERLGDLTQAERAFAQGGHRQLARRVAGRTDAQGGPPPSGPSKEVRDAAGAAYRELDAGDLSFSLAEPTSERTNADRVAQNAWSPVELGHVRVDERRDGRTLPQPKAEGRARPEAPPARPGQGSPNRRPTLIAPVGAPPAHDVPNEYAAVERLPAPSRTLAADDVAAASVPSVRHPVVAVPSPFGPSRSLDSPPTVARRTLPPPVVTPASVPPTSAATASVAPVAERVPVVEHAAPVVEPVAPVVERAAPVVDAAPPAVTASDRPSPPQRPAATRFPTDGVVLDRSGLALVRTTAETGFATRLESIRAQQSQLKIELLERRKNGKSNGESFGGVASPMVMATGAGELVLAPRTGRKLRTLALDDDLCFIREDVLLGFSASLTFENGRLATGEGETIAVVQLRGLGAVVLESIGDTLTLDVGADRSVNVRREAVLGWFGRLVPRALAPSEAPCGQRGLVAFAGEGYVILTSA